MRKYLIHCQRTHRDTRNSVSTAQPYSSVSELHITGTAIVSEVVIQHDVA